MSKKLSECQSQQHYRIQQVEGDVEVIRFFSRMGLYKGVEFELIQMINKHYIVYIKGSRYAMEKDLASMLVVEQL